jgi:FAD synthetase
MINKKVAIFGVFDGVHEGHLSFIKDAKKEGNHLSVIIARDNIVLELKNKLPKYNEVDRVDALLEIKEIDKVVLGDTEIDTYFILKEINPNIIFLGYDQDELHNSICEAIKNGNLPQVEIIRGNPHKPDIFHSSILNN